MSLGLTAAVLVWLVVTRRKRGLLRGVLTFGITWLVAANLLLWLFGSALSRPGTAMATDIGSYTGLDQMHHHVALAAALVVAWWVGIPRPRAESFLVPSLGLWIFLFRAVVGLHSARILLFGSWLIAGWILLTFTAVPDPAAAGVALPTTLFLAGVMVVDRARRWKYPGHFVWEWEDVPRSGSPLTAAQVGQQLSQILSSTGLRG